MGDFLSLRGIDKIYGNGMRALSQIDLTVAEGSFVSLVGPSGCGKSTLLRIVAGLMQPNAGRMDFAAGKPEIGFVFQEPVLLPWARAVDNVALPLTLKGMERRAARAKAAEALGRLGLSGFETAYARELSGGMKMRVSLARALIGKPRLLLLDEPFAALDEQTRQTLNDDLLRLWREQNLTILFVTHAVAESAYLSSEVVVMRPRPGRIATHLRMAQSPLPDPERRFTAAFGQASKRISEALQAAYQEAGR